MPQADITMGPEAEIAINDTLFTWTGGNLRNVWKRHDTNDSSNANSDQFRRGRGHLEASASFQMEKGRNIHAGPYNLGNDEFVDVKFYPNGSALGEPYHALKWLADDISIDLSGVKSGEPVTGTIGGTSSGDWFKPGDE